MRLRTLDLDISREC